MKNRPRRAVVFDGAGHGPILLYRAADDAVEQFEADDIPFGISSGIDYGPANDMQLAPGDILVLVTDGFFKWCNTAGTPQPDDLTAVVVKRVG